MVGTLAGKVRGSGSVSGSGFAGTDCTVVCRGSGLEVDFEHAAEGQRESGFVSEGSGHGGDGRS